MKSLKEFKKFLSENCSSEKEYGDCKYDAKIYNWFKKQNNILKPIKVEFYKKGRKVEFRKQ